MSSGWEIVMVVVFMGPSHTAAGVHHRGAGARCGGHPGLLAWGAAATTRRLPCMAAPTAGLATLVTDRVATALREHTRPFESLEGVEELLSAGEALLGGGKRLRAAFCTAGWTAFTDRPVTAGSAPVLAGSALELFQGAALAHDDLMDGSLTRRG